MSDENLEIPEAADAAELRAVTAEVAALLAINEAKVLVRPWRFTADQLSALKAIEQAGVSPNTRRSYDTARRYWQAWHQLRFGLELTLPVHPEVILHFILDHFAIQIEPGQAPRYQLPQEIEEQLREIGMKRGQGPLQPATIEQRVSVLSQMHAEMRDAAGGPVSNPCRDPYVVKMLRLVRKAYNRGAKQREADPTKGPRDAATQDIIQKMLVHCATDSLRHVRDRAVILVGFGSGGRRRSEIAGMCIEDLRTEGDGFMWKLGFTKTGDDRVRKPIQGKVALALREWLQRSKVHSGPVFREITVNGVMTDRPMSDQAIYRLVKNLADLAGLSGAWGAHSLRSGFVTQAGAEQYSLAETMDLSGHRSVQTVIGYYRAGANSTSEAGRLADKIKMPEIAPEPDVKRRRRRNSMPTR